MATSIGPTIIDRFNKQEFLFKYLGIIHSITSRIIVVEVLFLIDFTLASSFLSETQPFAFTHDLHHALELGFQVDCIFLDLSNALHKAQHTLLLSQVVKFNLNLKIS